jgi:hypothetical protein
MKAGRVAAALGGAHRYGGWWRWYSGLKAA